MGKTTVRTWATWAVANWLAFFVPFTVVPAEADTAAPVTP